jgi:hypothetical protein
LEMSILRRFLSWTNGGPSHSVMRYERDTAAAA